MLFITFVEHNFKEHEKFIFYLQWTGNEDALTWLHNTIKRSCCDGLLGDYSSFEMNVDVKFTQDMVDQHCMLSYGEYTNMFQKVVGLCTMCKLWRKNVGTMSPFQVADWLDDKFYAARIRNVFRVAQLRDEDLEVDTE